MLPYWVEFFEDLADVRGRSQNTVAAYRRDLELWSEYSKDSKTISGFFDFMKKRGLSVRSQARVISSIRTYYRFCETKGMNCPELKELKPPKVVTPPPKAISPTDFQKLVDASRVENSHRSIRNRLTLMLMYVTGCRVSELIQLNLDDFDRTQESIQIKGKAGKIRVAKLTKSLAIDLCHYIDGIRPDILKGPTESILLNDRGKRPSRIDLWRWLAAWSEVAGFEQAVNPHQIRHGCAASLIKSGHDLKEVQEILGHASIQSTQMYSSLVDEPKLQVSPSENL